MTRRVTLGEDISRLVSRRDGEQLEIAFLEMLASDVAVNLIVLGAFMEDIIMSNVDSTTIVTISSSGSGLWSIRVSQEPAKPDKLACDVSRARYSASILEQETTLLLLATPQDKRSTQQEAETCDRASISQITCLVYI